MQPVMRIVPGQDTGPENRISNDNRATPRPTTVLVVEDDVLVRMAIAGHLRDTGYRVIETATAEEARATLETREPVALVFSDINLPGAWQGTDLARWVRGRAPTVKVILTSSAYTLTGPKTCDSFLPKPYMAEEVASKVKKLLAH